jgi:hypothetical protein
LGTLYWRSSASQPAQQRKRPGEKDPLGPDREKQELLILGVPKQELGNEFNLDRTVNCQKKGDADVAFFYLYLNLREVGM